MANDYKCSELAACVWGGRNSSSITADRERGGHAAMPAEAGVRVAFDWLKD